VFSLADVAGHLGIEIHLPNPLSQATGASINTRTLEVGDLFVALKGSQVDGHSYLESAFHRGASGALISKEYFEVNRERLLASQHRYHNLLIAPDPRKSLSDAAKWYRSRFDVKAIGITGTLGKTSTKEFLHYVIRQQFPVLANAGNLNNLLGLSLTLFRLRAGDRYCIAEIAASHQGEIRELAAILNPDAAIITQVTPVHLEGFGSMEGIYAAKLEILETLPQKAFVILPDDDPILLERVRDYDVQTVKVGESIEANYRISNVHLKKGYVRFRINDGPLRSFPGIASFQVRNAAMAIAMAEILGVKMEDIPRVWKKMVMPSGRFEEKTLPDGIRLIHDGYSASPFAFNTALDTFCGLEVTGKRFLVFADMLELGEEAPRYHTELGFKIAQCPLDGVFAYGNLAKVSVDAIRMANASFHVKCFEDVKDVVCELKNELKPGDAILFKASRGMNIENVINEFEMTSVN